MLILLKEEATLLADCKGTFGSILKILIVLRYGAVFYGLLFGKATLFLL